jgi:hypothetical protein
MQMQQDAQRNEMLRQQMAMQGDQFNRTFGEQQRLNAPTIAKLQLENELLNRKAKQYDTVSNLHTAIGNTEGGVPGGLDALTKALGSEMVSGGFTGPPSPDMFVDAAKNKVRGLLTATAGSDPSQANALLDQRLSPGQSSADLYNKERVSPVPYVQGNFVINPRAQTIQDFTSPSGVGAANLNALMNYVNTEDLLGRTAEARAGAAMAAPLAQIVSQQSMQGTQPRTFSYASPSVIPTGISGALPTAGTVSQNAPYPAHPLDPQVLQSQGISALTNKQTGAPMYVKQRPDGTFDVLDWTADRGWVVVPTGNEAPTTQPAGTPFANMLPGMMQIPPKQMAPMGPPPQAAATPQVPQSPLVESVPQQAPPFVDPAVGLIPTLADKGVRLGADVISNNLLQAQALMRMLSPMGNSPLMQALAPVGNFMYGMPQGGAAAPTSSELQQFRLQRDLRNPPSQFIQNQPNEQFIQGKPGKQTQPSKTRPRSSLLDSLFPGLK